jgi:membrane protein
MVVGIGFLLLVSLVVTAWLAAMGAYVSYLLPTPAWALEVLNSVISLAVITGAFALIFKLLPHVKIAWRDVWLGAAGSLVIIVVWVYYSAQILLFGVEFTKVWTKRRGSGFKVERTAKPVTAEARAEQGLGPKRRA